MKARRIMIPAAVLAGSLALLTPAAAQADEVEPIGQVQEVGDYPEPTFGDAYETFQAGGANLGLGAAQVIAGAYTGIADTPALIAYSFMPTAG
jgi:hypothetical protein